MTHTLTQELARAKVNLTLHVGAVRHDGYHPLESLVVFADIGDVITAEKARDFSLTIDGPFGNDLSSGQGNLILKAARLSGQPAAKFHLTKNLPIASGIGGGSADAAAALRLLTRLYGPNDMSGDIALKLGADIPVCYGSRSCIMSGIGEKISSINDAQNFAGILVNPAIPVSTGAIFKAFDEAGSGRGALKHKGESMLDMARLGRNDLQDIACTIEPAISQVLEVIAAQDKCKIARMSGSGASCFGIFETDEQARQAAKRIKAMHPNWWCVATRLGG